MIRPAYLTPDVTADFRASGSNNADPDVVAVSGGSGIARPEKLKVTLGFHEGYMGEGQISYAGPGCVARGQLALDIVEERLKRLGNDIIEFRLDLIGVNSVAPNATRTGRPMRSARPRRRANAHAASRGPGRT